MSHNKAGGDAFAWAVAGISSVAVMVFQFLGPPLVLVLWWFVDGAVALRFLGFFLVTLFIASGPIVRSVLPRDDALSESSSVWPVLVVWGLLCGVAGLFLSFNYELWVRALFFLVAASAATSPLRSILHEFNHAGLAQRTDVQRFYATTVTVSVASAVGGWALVALVLRVHLFGELQWLIVGAAIAVLGLIAIAWAHRKQKAGDHRVRPRVIEVSDEQFGRLSGDLEGADTGEESAPAAVVDSGEVSTPIEDDTIELDPVEGVNAFRVLVNGAYVAQIIEIGLQLDSRERWAVMMNESVGAKKARTVYSTAVSAAGYCAQAARDAGYLK